MFDPASARFLRAVFWLEPALLLRLVLACPPGSGIICTYGTYGAGGSVIFCYPMPNRRIVEQRQ